MQNRKQENSPSQCLERHVVGPNGTFSARTHERTNVKEEARSVIVYQTYSSGARVAGPVRHLLLDEVGGGGGR